LVEQVTERVSESHCLITTTGKNGASLRLARLDATSHGGPIMLNGQNHTLQYEESTHSAQASGAK
jgi:hypothetical protein